MKVLTVNECSCDISAKHLQTGSIFGALSHDAIDFLLSSASLQEYEKNEAVFTLDEHSDCFYIILDGSVGLFKLVDDNKKQIDFGISTVKFGEAVGYVTMIALQPRNADARALEKTLLLKVDSMAFNKMHDAFAFNFGIFILNLSRDLARKIYMLSGTMANAELSVNSKRT